LYLNYLQSSRSTTKDLRKKEMLSQQLKGDWKLFTLIGEQNTWEREIREPI
jgi:hypothetical protein